MASSSRSLHRRSILWTTVLFLTVVLGALVTSSDAGLASGVWPLSAWTNFKPGTKGLHTLQTHRYLGILAALLTFWVGSQAVRIARTKAMAHTAMALAGAQVGLGIAMSLNGLPPWLTFLHGVMAQSLFCVAAGTTAMLNPKWSEPPTMVEEAGAISLRTIGWVTLGALSLQIMLGGLHRHGLMGLIPHVALAMVLGVLVMFACMAILTNFSEHAVLKRAAYVLLGLFLAQILIGIAAYLGRIGVVEDPSRSSEILMWIGTVAHVITGALTIGSSLVFALQILRNVQPENAGRAESSPPAAVST